METTQTTTQYVKRDFNPRYVRPGDEYEISHFVYGRGYEKLRVRVTKVEKRDSYQWERFERKWGNVVYRIWHEPVNKYLTPHWFFAFVEYGSKETIDIERPV